MNLAKIVRTALTALTTNKMRSALTVLGIIIGVTAVITLMSIGRGSQASITSNIESLGTNLVFVRAGSSSQGMVRGAQGSAATLTLEDAEALADPELAPSVASVAPQVSTFAQIVAGGENTNTQILGVTPEYQSVRNYQVADGEFISDAQVEAKSMVAVLGSDVAETLFGSETSPVGQYIKINGRQFKVIGVLQSKGGTGFGSQDDIVLAPISTVQYRLSSQRTASGGKTVQTINVQVVSTDQTDAAIQQITSILRERHNIASGEDDDFTISSQQETIEALQESTQVWVLLLGAIAGISLLVGGIGIMNIMLVSVTERTREIGIRKALGAKRRDILLQFLIEAALMSLIGGGIGVFVGWGASSLISGTSLGGTTIQTVMSVDIPILAVSVSAAIGILFGLYPAYKAARLNPIEALRYE
ncbi:MAG: ABC transporter permease [Chloroflexi bacterium]|nr:ABC transporter permease [Chloroflexota bacterium]